MKQINRKLKKKKYSKLEKLSPEESRNWEGPGWWTQHVMSVGVSRRPLLCCTGLGTPLQSSSLENPMEEPGGLQSMESLRVRHDWATSLSLFTFHFHALEKAMATHSSVLAWRTPGMGEPGGLPSMGSYRVGHNWSNLAAAAVSFYFMNWLRSIVS